MTSEEVKREGNEFFKKKEFQKAIECYTAALLLDPQNHLLYGNRSLALLHLERNDEALLDAQQAIQIKSDWHKVGKKK